MLPDWIELPAPRPAAEIDYVSGVYVLLSNGEVMWAEKDIYDVYKLSKDYNTEFTPAAIKECGGDETWLGLRLPPDDRGHIPVMLSLSDIERWDMLQADFHEAVCNIRRWRENPSLDNAYWMLDTHPAFWSRRTDEPTWDWEASGHMQRVWFAPTGGGGWTMETGGHTEDMTSHFHDLRLDVYSDTFENCILKMAELVDKFFHEDGNEREGVEYEKSELELILKERLRKLDNEG